MTDHNDPKLAPRFMGIPTFMRTPLQQDPKGLDIALAGVLDPRRTVQFGIRGAQNFADGWDFSSSTGMRVIFMEEFTALVGATLMYEILCLLAAAVDARGRVT